MRTTSASSLLVALLLLGGVAQVQAQTTNRSVTPVPQRPAPTPPSLFPAGPPTLPNTATAPNNSSTTGTPATATSPSQPATATAPTTTQPMTPPLDGTVLMPGSAIGGVTTSPATNATTVMGAGGGPNPSQTVPSGAGPYTALQLAESFQGADANRDGELSRAEFQRLRIAPASFEEMDRDRNGIVTRSEYDDGSR